MSDDKIDIRYNIADINEMTGIDRKKANREIISQLNSDLDNFSQNEYICLLYTSPSPRDVEESRMPSSA